MKILFYIQLLVMVFLTGCGDSSNHQNKINNMDTFKKQNPVFSTTDTQKVNIGDEEWRKILPKEVYEIAREKGTERAFTGKYYEHKEVGTYYCAACGNPLFNSNGKFESSCGWPSFFEPITKGSIIYAPDNAYGMKRTEVMCGRCKSHLGHVFEDGPPPTGLRYCINSVILDFEKAKSAEQDFNKKDSAK
jgi:peptide-methionine (R)-S-oxide reductase